MKHTKPFVHHLGLLATLFVGGLLAGCSSPADKAIDQLGGTTQEIEAAKMELSLMEPPPVSDILSRLRRGGDPKLLKNAAMLLGQMAVKYSAVASPTADEAVNGLVDCLKDGKEEVEAACVWGLSQAKSEKGFKALHPLTLAKGDVVRAAAMEVLGEKVSLMADEAGELLQEGKPEEAMTRAEEALALYPSSGAAIALMAEAKSAAADETAASEWWGKMGALTTFKALGPLPPLSKKDWAKDPPKKWTKPSDEQMDGYEGYSIGWQDLTATEPGGYLNLEEPFPVSGASAMVVLNLKVPRGAKEHVLSFRFREKARIWINESNLYNSTSAATGRWDEARIRTRLRPGKNNIRMLLTQQGGLWGVGVRVLNQDGAPVEGVEVE